MGCLNVKISNNFSSTSFSPEETVDDIRKNSPQSFKSQNRLVTKNDYEIFIKKNYKDLISDIKLLNNEYFMISSSITQRKLNSKLSLNIMVQVYY